METGLTSPMSGRVRAVHVLPAAQVIAGDVLVEIEEAAEQSSDEAVCTVVLAAENRR